MDKLLYETQLLTKSKIQCFKIFQNSQIFKVCTNINDIKLSKSMCSSEEMQGMKIKNNLQYFDVCTKLFNIH